MAKDTRLQKMLAECGIASRRKAEEMIAAGRVAVNGVRAQIHIILCLCAGIICVDVENIEQSDGEQTENTPPYERQIKRKRAPFLPFHHLF